LPILAVAYKGDAFDPANKMVAASYLLGNLAFGQTSDLYKQLVIREQKVQALEPDFGFNRDPKLLTIFAMVNALTADLNAVNILYDTISQLTPEDIRAAARHYFVQKHRTIIILKGDQ